MCANIEGQIDGGLLMLVVLVLGIGFISYAGYLAWFKPHEYQKIAFLGHNFNIQHLYNYSLWSARIIIPLWVPWAVVMMIRVWQHLVQLSAAAAAAGCH
jgi:hypothetical protein